MSNAANNTNDDQQSSDESCEPQVPIGVLRGIRDLEKGNTSSKEDLDSVLEF